ncbi:MAG: chemotaxis protein CheW [Blastomonas sp.]
MKDLYLIARIAGERVAIAAQWVESVVKVSDATPIPSAAPYIAGLYALRSRVLTLIDCQFHLTGEQQDLRVGQNAVVVEVGGFSYGLLVDEVSDVITVASQPRPLQRKLPAGWELIGTAVLEDDAETYLVIDPARLINPALAHAA